MSFRSLTFASLLFAAAPELAHAQIPEMNTAPSGLQVAPSFEITVKGDVLTAKLTLFNTGDRATDVLVARGSSPGTHVTATIDGDSLERQFDPSEERETFSRMGPMPRYETVAAKGQVNGGTYRFKLPKGAAGKALTLSATVRAQDGSYVTVPITITLGAQKAV